MKYKVTDVVTMAWNDHRISLSNEDVKIELTVLDTIEQKVKPLLDLKRGDEVDLFNDDTIAELKSKIDFLSCENSEQQSALALASDAREKFIKENSDLVVKIDELTDENKNLGKDITNLKKEITDLKRSDKTKKTEPVKSADAQQVQPS